jgi:hypothetical protein
LNVLFARKLFLNRRLTERRLSFFVSAGLSLLTLGFAPGACAQQQTDLAFQNMSRVAASPPEMKAILSSDAGLMLELKRWAAKDATEHGQIVTDRLGPERSCDQKIIDMRREQ